MSKETAENIITGNVEQTALARFEHPARVCDPNVLPNTFVAYSGSGILKFIPDPDTIFDRYVVKIDADIEKYMTEYLRMDPGNILVAFDGVLLFLVARMYSTLCQREILRCS
jgi:hypothetical protein